MKKLGNGKDIEEMLEKMIKKNCSRVDFAQKYKQIIDDYNAGNSENEEYYDELMKLKDQWQDILTNV